MDMAVFSSERTMLVMVAEASPAAIKKIASLSALIGVDCCMALLLWGQQRTWW
jgi:hypothetical protein